MQLIHTAIIPTHISGFFYFCYGLSTRIFLNMGRVYHLVQFVGTIRPPKTEEYPHNKKNSISINEHQKQKNKNVRHIPELISVSIFSSTARHRRAAPTSPTGGACTPPEIGFALTNKKNGLTQPHPARAKALVATFFDLQSRFTCGIGGDTARIRHWLQPISFFTCPKRTRNQSCAANQDHYPKNRKNKFACFHNRKVAQTC
ncbi:MAG: hypothetical protein AAF429_08540 [Pseudomonadota bacterium]